jgi:hypothetical protein
MKPRGKLDEARQSCRAGDIAKQRPVPAPMRRTRSGVSAKAVTGEQPHLRAPGNGHNGQTHASEGAASLVCVEAESPGRRRFGLRGSAPWAARHAAKHAAETAARNAEPVMPGSARATLRTPAEAESLKERIHRLHSALARIAELRRSLPAHFYELGLELRTIREQKLYEAKGYYSFEAFVDREVPIGKATATKLSRVPDVFFEGAATHFGLDAVLAALDALEESVAPHDVVAGPVVPVRPAKPPRRQ